MCREATGFYFTYHKYFIFKHPHDNDMIQQSFSVFRPFIFIFLEIYSNVVAQFRELYFQR